MSGINSANQPKRTYEKPTLQRLGLLRLLTRYSIAGDHDRHDHDDHHKRED
jgi:hypothetical protein